MGLENLPKVIQDEIKGIGKDKDSYYDRSDREIHVTELLYCIRKSFFGRKFPIEPTLEQAFWLYRGNLLDQAWTSKFRLNQLRCTHRVPNSPVTIVGKYDFFNDETGELCDLKTVKSLYYIVKDGTAKLEHQKQVQFYCYENGIDKARVFYMDFGDVVDFPVAIGDCSTLILELEEKARILYNALQTNEPPSIDVKKREWMCASTDWRTGKIKQKENGSDAINCPYFFKCYKSKEEFEESLNVKVSTESKTVKVATKFTPEKDAPVITVTKKKGKVNA